MTAIEVRKRDHIDINLQRNVEPHTLRTGLERLQFISNPLPELDLASVSTTTTYLGHRLNAPLLISTMTAFLVTSSGRSAWFVGVLVLMVYLIFAMTLYLLPPGKQ